jgi:signal transduction histidine kinase
MTTIRNNNQVILYQHFSRANTNMGELPHVFKHAKDMGFTAIQLRPNQENSGNPYAVTNHMKIDKKFKIDSIPMSAEEQLKNTIEIAHQTGLYIFMGLPLHTASVQLGRYKPDWFIREPGNGFKHATGLFNQSLKKNNHFFSQKSPLLLFNYENPAVKTFMLDVMKYWVNFGFDGQKIGSPDKIPVDFWIDAKKLIEHLNPSYTFIAETTGCTDSAITELLKSGLFDYYTNMTHRWKLDKQSAWTTIAPLSGRQASSLSFADNIHTNRIINDKDLFPEYYHETIGKEGVIAALELRYAIAALTATGTIMSAGYEYGYKTAVDPFKSYQHHEEPIIDISDFIGKVNGLKGSYQVFGEDGGFIILDTDHTDKINKDKICFCEKTNRDRTQRAYIIANKDVLRDRTFKLLDFMKAYRYDGIPLEKIKDVSPKKDVNGAVNLNGDKITLKPGEVKVLMFAESDARPIRLTPFSALEKQTNQALHGIAHDIRNLSNGGWMNLLLQELEARGVLPEKLINKDSASLTEIIEILKLSFGRIASMTLLFPNIPEILKTGSLKPNPCRFNIKDAINETIQLKSIFAAENKVKILPIEKMDVPPEICADKGLINEVLENLIDNAIKYNHEGGEVWVSGKKIGNECIEISVHDNGLGIHKDDIPYIFNFQVRGEKTKNEKQGTGMGLSFTKTIIEAHGGSIRVASKEGKGSTFTFTLPI